MNAKVTKASKREIKTLHVTNAKQYHVGIPILIGADNVEGQEIRRIVAIGGSGGSSASASGASNYSVVSGDTLGKIANPLEHPSVPYVT